MKQPQNLIVKILQSVFFKKATGEATQYAKNPNSILKLLQNVLTKSKSLSGSTFEEVKEKLNLLARMLRSYAKGQYRAVPLKTISSIVAALIYFLSPVDFIPDFLPIIGLTDDVALLLWLYNSLSDDIDAFRTWEKEQNTISIG